MQNAETPASNQWPVRPPLLIRVGLSSGNWASIDLSHRFVIPVLARERRTIQLGRWSADWGTADALARVSDRALDPSAT
jgi:hypothetical protein